MVPLTAQRSTFGVTVRGSMWAETTKKNHLGADDMVMRGLAKWGFWAVFHPHHAKASKSYEFTSYVRDGPVTRQLCCRLFG